MRNIEVSIKYYLLIHNIEYIRGHDIFSNKNSLHQKPIVVVIKDPISECYILNQYLYLQSQFWIITVTLTIQSHQPQTGINWIMKNYFWYNLQHWIYQRSFTPPLRKISSSKSNSFSLSDNQYLNIIDQINIDINFSNSTDKLSPFKKESHQFQYENILNHIEAIFSKYMELNPLDFIISYMEKISSSKPNSYFSSKTLSTHFPYWIKYDICGTNSKTSLFPSQFNITNTNIRRQWINQHYLLSNLKYWIYQR